MTTRRTHPTHNRRPLRTWLAAAAAVLAVATFLTFLPTPAAPGGETDGDPATNGDAEAGVQTVMAKPQEPELEAAPVVRPGPVSDFASGPEAAIGVGRWVPSTDQRMGGTSVVDLAAVDGALRIRGEIRPGFPYPWAGAFLMTNNPRMEPADLSRVGAIAFRARGAGDRSGVLRVFAFAPELGTTPAIHTVELTGDWQRFEVALAEFGVTNGQVSAFLIGGNDEPGPFEMWIDDVELVAAEGTGEKTAKAGGQSKASQ